jgi:putative ABC transport system permease protein
MWLHDLLQDLFYGVRMLRKNPGFTAVAVMSLALGIGANTAILGAMGSVVRGGLPYPEPDRLFMIRTFPLDNPSQLRNATLSEFYEWKLRSRTFENMGASLADQKDLDEAVDAKAPEHIQGKLFSSELFPTLGIQPVAGRLFTQDEYLPGLSRPVVLISADLWTRRFGADPGIVNRQVLLDNTPTTVVGVMPSYFPYSEDRIEYWLPMPVRKPTLQTVRFFIVTGRLRKGVTQSQAQSEMNSIAEQLARDFPDRNRGWGVQLQPLRENIYGWTMPTLFTLEAAVAFVLLIACANVAGLLLARGAARKPEIAMRVALGAGRGRVVRQLLTESILLALIGGAFGLFVARWGLTAISAMTPPPGAPRLGAIPITPGAFGLTALTSILTGIAFGIFPAIAGFRTDLADSLKKGPRGTATYSTNQRLRGMLIAGQIALAFMLLIGFGLMMQSLVRLSGRDLHMDPSKLLSFEFRIPQQEYVHDIGSYRDSRYVEIAPNPSLTLERVFERLRQLRGIVAVAGSSYPPVNSLILPLAPVIPEGRMADGEIHAGNTMTTAYFMVTPNFFNTVRAPLLRGRDFTDQDGVSTPWVAIVNETAARRMWPGEDPIGKRFTLDIVPEERPREVVGVAPDIPTRTRQTAQDPVVYLSYLQHPSRSGPNGNMYGLMSFVIRADDPMGLVPAVRQAVAEIEPQRPVAKVATAMGYVGARLDNFGRYVSVLGVFALVAVLLAVIGVYGVTAYTVAQRTREIAIRAALGAGALEILMLVGRRAIVFVCAGLLAGFVSALALSRLIESQLWGITPTDSMTFAAVSLLLAIVGLLACAIPARRAIQVDPTIALRSE